MEFLLTLYEAAQVYAFFCLVTSLTIGVINGQLLWSIRPFSWAGNFSYMLTTITVSFLFAPVFFFILLFFGEVYRSAIFSSLMQYVDTEDE